MKTAKFTLAIVTFSFVLFMSSASMANSGAVKTGDLPKSGDKSLNISSTIEKDYSYLRFDANKYYNENEEVDAIHSSLVYLRFNANDFISENQSEAIELPVANDFEYLRFGLSNFAETNSDTIIDLPVNEYDYLRFDATDFVSSNFGIIDELPVTE